jgi:PhnB protein
MKTVTTYLNFDGNCRQAMSFYQQSLGSELQLSPFPDSNGQPSSDPAAKIMHSQLSHGGAPILMASDTPPGGSLGNNFSVSVDCESVDEMERLFTSLSQGGQIRMPLGNMPWGARFGMLTEQFGVQWIFNCNLQQTAWTVADREAHEKMGFHQGWAHVCRAACGRRCETLMERLPS